MVPNETRRELPEASPLVVSVIIPVLNDAVRLRLCLQHLVRQTYPQDSIEILVIDNGSKDSLEPIKSDFPQIVWLFEPQRSSYAARNKGVYHASGEILAFTDSDCLPHPEWIQAGIDQLTLDKAADVIVGRIDHVYPRSQPRTLLEWYQSIYGFQQASFVCKYQFGATANLMVFKKTFTEIGMFEGTFESGGDQDWGQTAVRAGYSLIYAPGVRVGHPTRDSYLAYFSRVRRHARGLMSIDYKYQRSQRTILERSLHPFVPRLSNFRTILQRRGKLPLLKVPVIFLLNWLINIIRGSERLLVSLKNLIGKIKFKIIMVARQCFPHPRMWAFLSRNRIPNSIISGKKSGLRRPESISFSPSGDILGVCNSEAHSVVFYSELHNQKGAYAQFPSIEISDEDRLNYVHDAVLSPCGNYVVTVSRDAHKVSVFFPFDKENSQSENKPLHSFSGEKSFLFLPTGVAVHPSGKFIAVTNRQKYGITLYRQLGENGHFNPSPFQQVSDDEFYKHDLASPCGVDFSPDGNYLVIVHKRYTRKGKFWRGQSGLTIFSCMPEPQHGIDPDPTRIKLHGLAELHSVCFHPSAKLIAVSIEGARAVIYKFSKDFEHISELDSIPIFRIGASLKGVGFTKDGKRLAVTTALNEVLFFKLPSKYLQTKS